MRLVANQRLVGYYLDWIRRGRSYPTSPIIVDESQIRDCQFVDHGNQKFLVWADGSKMPIGDEELAANKVMINDIEWMIET